MVDGDGAPDPDTGDDGGPPRDGELYGAIMAAGFDRKIKSAVEVGADAATGMRFKTGGSFSGTLGDGGVMDLEASPLLGADERFLYPRLRSVGIGSDITSVQSYRQLSRTLATDSAMIRDVDAVSTKPSTNTVSELLAEAVKQIASISSATPNVLLENDGFRQWVQTDLVLAYRKALDYMITTEIAAAATTVTGSAAGNAYEDILQAQMAVEGQGYNPTTVVLSPADALALRLLTMASGVTYAFSQAPPAIVVTPSIGDGIGFVLDPAAAGTLYLSPARFAVFEENAGATNTSTARFESHGILSCSVRRRSASSAGARNRPASSLGRGMGGAGGPPPAGAARFLPGVTSFRRVAAARNATSDIRPGAHVQERRKGRARGRERGRGSPPASPAEERQSCWSKMR